MYVGISLVYPDPYKGLGNKARSAAFVGEE